MIAVETIFYRGEGKKHLVKVQLVLYAAVCRLAKHQKTTT